MTRPARLTDDDLAECARVLAEPHPEGLSMTAWGEERLSIARRLLGEVHRMRPATSRAILGQK